MNNVRKDEETKKRRWRIKEKWKIWEMKNKTREEWRIWARKKMRNKKMWMKRKDEEWIEIKR